MLWLKFKSLFWPRDHLEKDVPLPKFDWRVPNQKTEIKHKPDDTNVLLAYLGFVTAYLKKHARSDETRK